MIIAGGFIWIQNAININVLFFFFLICSIIHFKHPLNQINTILKDLSWSSFFVPYMCTYLFIYIVVSCLSLYICVCVCVYSHKTEASSKRNGNVHSPNFDILAHFPSSTTIVFIVLIASVLWNCLICVIQEWSYILYFCVLCHSKDKRKKQRF